MRKLIILLVCCTVVLGVGYVGYRGYKVWKQKHLMTMARDYLAKSDGRNAFLCVQQALASNPQDLEASRMMMTMARDYLAKSDGRNAFLCVRQVLASNPQDLEASRMMAGFLEANLSSAALLWRSHVVDLNPKSTDDRLALAQSALLFRNYPVATNALDGVDAAGKETAAYQDLAGTTAIAANQPAEAETHFLEAARLEPQNPVPQLNLAMVHLYGTNQAALATARSALNQLSANPTNSALRCKALRELILDAARHQQTNNALDLSLRLVQQTNCPYRDRLLRLDVLRGASSPDFRPTLAAFQQDAATNLAKIYDLANWQAASLGPAEALAWLRTLSPDIQTNQPVASMAAECQIALGDWRNLQVSLTNQNWADSDFRRHAFIACALRGQNLADSSKAEWEQALRSVKTAPDPKAALVTLRELAIRWGWHTEDEDILWTIFKQDPANKRAAAALAQALFEAGRTRSLMSLYDQQLKAYPSDLRTKNDLAMTALLLDAQEFKPHDLTRDVYQMAPTNAAFASTYAFSLYLQKKYPDALKVMQKLKPQDLENPGIAGYYALILKATGNTAQAATYLAFATNPKLKFLPEEKKLFDKARSGS